MTSCAYRVRMRIIVLSCLLLAACGDAMPADRPVLPAPPAQALKSRAPEAPTPLYGTCEQSQDGIGKTFMDREIAEVMGHQGAGWLERPTPHVHIPGDADLDGLHLIEDGPPSLLRLLDVLVGIEAELDR